MEPLTIVDQVDVGNLWVDMNANEHFAETKVNLKVRFEAHSQSPNILKDLKDALCDLRDSKRPWTITAKFVWTNPSSPTLNLEVGGQFLFEDLCKVMYGKLYDPQLLFPFRVQGSTRYRHYRQIDSFDLRGVLQIANSTAPFVLSGPPIRLPDTLFSDNHSGSYLPSLALLPTLKFTLQVKTTHYVPVRDLHLVSATRNEKLLNDGNSADFVLEAMDRQNLTCHTLFLKPECSPVFRAMLDGGRFKECQEKRMRFPEHSFSALNGFLRFIYCGDVSNLLQDSYVCFEIFKFADEYDVEDLEKAAAEIIIGQNQCWFTVLGCLQMYDYLGHYDGVWKSDVMTRVLRVLSGFNVASWTNHPLFKAWTIHQQEALANRVLKIKDDNNDRHIE